MLETQTTPIPSEELEISEEEYEKLVRELKDFVLEYAKNHDAKDWFLSSIKQQYHLDGLVSDMRHFPDGQIAVLEKLHELKPDLTWYRGGTVATWRDRLGISRNYSPEELEHLVIDGGANGALGRPEIAMNFLNFTKRDEPVIYHVSIPALIDGLKSRGIALVTEHSYDLCILPGQDRKAYLDFCSKHLNITSAESKDSVEEVLDSLSTEERINIVLQSFTVGAGSIEAHNIYVLYLCHLFSLSHTEGARLLSECLTSLDETGKRKIVQAAYHEHLDTMKNATRMTKKKTFDQTLAFIGNFQAAVQSIERQLPRIWADNAFDDISEQEKSRINALSRDFNPSIDSDVVKTLRDIANAHNYYKNKDWVDKKEN